MPLYFNPLDQAEEKRPEDPCIDMNDSLKKAAILPFQLVESLGLTCGYERSFKLCQHEILANRYLLGIETRQINEAHWQRIQQQLNMPQNFIADFNAGLADANLALLGFEARANGSAIFKLYLEYWEQLQAIKQQQTDRHSRHLLHLGFKWEYDAPQHQQITHYHCLPDLNPDEVISRIADQYSEFPASAGLNSSLHIYEKATQARPKADFLYIEVSEPGNSRQSFDLNLYPAELTIADIAREIQAVSIAMNIDQEKFARLMKLVENKILGHISAGTGRDGLAYFSVYYEN